MDLANDTESILLSCRMFITNHFVLYISSFTQYLINFYLPFSGVTQRHHICHVNRVKNSIPIPTMEATNSPLHRTRTASMKTVFSSKTICRQNVIICQTYCQLVPKSIRRHRATVPTTTFIPTT